MSSIIDFFFFLNLAIKFSRKGSYYYYNKKKDMLRGETDRGGEEAK